MAWMANAHWPGRSQTRASRHMDSPRAVAPTRKSTASLQAGGTLCRMRRGAPCAAAPVAKVCTRTRARPVCFTGCPLFRANHFGPSPLPIGQGAWQGRGSLITVNIGDRVRPPPPPPPAPAPRPADGGGYGDDAHPGAVKLRPPFARARPSAPALSRNDPPPGECARTPPVIHTLCVGGRPLDGRATRPEPPPSGRDTGAVAPPQRCRPSHETRAVIEAPRRGEPPPRSPVVSPPTCQQRPLSGGGGAGAGGARDASPGLHTPPRVLLDTRAGTPDSARTPPATHTLPRSPRIPLVGASPPLPAYSETYHIPRRGGAAVALAGTVVERPEGLAAARVGSRGTRGGPRMAVAKAHGSCACAGRGDGCGGGRRKD